MLPLLGSQPPLRGEVSAWSFASHDSNVSRSVLPEVAIGVLGTRGSLVCDGLVLPALALITWPRLRRIDQQATTPAALDALSQVETLRLLPAPRLERLARHAHPIALRAGETLFEQGEAPDYFYLLREGQLELRIDDHPATRLHPGEGFARSR